MSHGATAGPSGSFLIRLAMPSILDIRSRVHLRQRPHFGLATMIPFGFAAVVLVVLITRFDVDMDATWQKVKASNLLFFALAVVVHYTTFVFRGLRWRVLLRNVQGGGPPIPSAVYCGKLILLAWFINSVTWFRLGDVYRAYAYADTTGQSFSRTIGTVLAERILDMVLVFLLMVVAALLLVVSGVGPSWLFVGLAATLVGVLCSVLAAMALFRWRLAYRLPSRIRQAYHQFHQGTLGSFQQLPLVAVLSLLGWLAEVGRLYLVSRAVDVDIGIGLVMFVVLVNSMLTLVPLTPGGLGLVEPGIVGLLMLSLTKNLAVPVVLLDRSISYLSVIVSGAVIFLAIQVLKRRRPARSSVMAKGG